MKLETLEGSFSAVSTTTTNTRWKALDEIVKIYTLLHRSTLKINQMLHKIFYKTFAMFTDFAKFAKSLHKSVIFR